MALTQTQLQARNWFAAKAAVEAKIATVAAGDITAIQAAGIIDANLNYLPPVPTYLTITITQGS